MSSPWRDGNRVRLLANGEQYYPRVLAAIEAAEREVLLETFILFQDTVGMRLHQALVDAGRRGVRVQITVDSYGTPDLSRGFVESLAEAGVRMHVFDPGTRWFGMRLNMFRRMHRKLVCVDRRLAYVAGLNFSADHLSSFGPLSKQDYAVEIEGPVVTDIHAFLMSVLDPQPRARFRELAVDEYPPTVEPATRLMAGDVAVRDPEEEPALTADQNAPVTASSDDACIAFVTRDNTAHRRDIERYYRHAMTRARRHIIIANAYFFPGYGFLRNLRKAARRGVEVHLVLQGRPDEPIAMHAARLLYRHLADAGVCIHEYGRRPLHGKVAVFDDEVTVGSSNLDPISLSLNLEANVFIRDAVLATGMREHLESLIGDECAEVDTREERKPSVWRGVRSAVVFHFLRRFPYWAGLLPAHTPLLGRLEDRPRSRARRARSSPDSS